MTVETGDRVWWKWPKQVEITVKLDEANLLFDKKLDTTKCKSTGGCEELDSNGLAKAGVYCYLIRKAGVYCFSLSNGKEHFTTTVVATSVQKDHKVLVSDNGVKPSILNINPEDRVWFVWDETKKPHNIRQITHQNEIVPNGFLSGSLMEAPGVFVECFNEVGIFYYRSDNVKNMMGAIVVVPEPTVS